MKAAIISDLHANYEATKAVLADSRRRGVDAIYCLGDYVDYGASPDETIDLIRDIPDDKKEQIKIFSYNLELFRLSQMKTKQRT